MSDHSWTSTQALVHIANVLGSGQCPENHCEGCKYETAEARLTAVHALGYETWEEFHKVVILGEGS